MSSFVSTPANTQAVRQRDVCFHTIILQCKGEPQYALIIAA